MSVIVFSSCVLKVPSGKSSLMSPLTTRFTLFSSLILKLSESSMCFDTSGVSVSFLIVCSASA